MTIAAIYQCCVCGMWSIVKHYRNTVIPSWFMWNVRDLNDANNVTATTSPQLPHAESWTCQVFCDSQSKIETKGLNWENKLCCIFLCWTMLESRYLHAVNAVSVGSAPSAAGWRLVVLVATSWSVRLTVAIPAWSSLPEN